MSREPNRAERRAQAKADTNRQLRQSLRGFIGAADPAACTSTAKLLANADRLLAERKRKHGYRGKARITPEAQTAAARIIAERNPLLAPPANQETTP